jgi:hypothetical protein
MVFWSTPLAISKVNGAREFAECHILMDVCLQLGIKSFLRGRRPPQYIPQQRSNMCFGIEVSDSGVLDRVANLGLGNALGTTIWRQSGQSPVVGFTNDITMHPRAYPIPKPWDTSLLSEQSGTWIRVNATTAQTIHGLFICWPATAHLSHSPWGSQAKQRPTNHPTTSHVGVDPRAS